MENVSQIEEAKTSVSSSAMSMLTLSPSVRPSPVANTLYPSLDDVMKSESKQRSPKTSVESKKPQSERMHHNIPHR